MDKKYYKKNAYIKLALRFERYLLEIEFKTLYITESLKVGA